MPLLFKCFDIKALEFVFKFLSYYFYIDIGFGTPLFSILEEGLGSLEL
jgi:hypothetical protein